MNKYQITYINGNVDEQLADGWGYTNGSENITYAMFYKIYSESRVCVRVDNKAIVLEIRTLEVEVHA